jgi:hypothetical protein
MAQAPYEFDTEVRSTARRNAHFDCATEGVGEIDQCLTCNLIGDSVRQLVPGLSGGIGFAHT